MCLNFYFFPAKSASQQLFTHHVVGKFRLFKQSQQVSSFSHTTWFGNLVRLRNVSNSAAFHRTHSSEIWSLQAKSACQLHFTHHMVWKFSMLKQSQHVSSFSHIYRVCIQRIDTEETHMHTPHGWEIFSL